MQASVMAIEALPVILRVEDVQRVLGISRQTAYEIVHQKGFPLIRIGRVMRVPRDSFLTWLEREANAGGK